MLTAGAAAAADKDEAAAAAVAGTSAVAAAVEDADSDATPKVEAAAVGAAMRMVVLSRLSRTVDSRRAAEEGTTDASDAITCDMGFIQIQTCSLFGVYEGGKEGRLRRGQQTQAMQPPAV